MQESDQLAGTIIDVKLENRISVEDVSEMWDLNEYQIENGGFEGFIKCIHTPFLQLCYVSRSTGTILKGDSPENCYMFAYIYPQNEGTVTHNGLAMVPNELLVLEENDQIDLMASQAYRNLSIAVNTEFFDREYQNCFYDSFTYDKLRKRSQIKEDMAPYFNQSLIKLVTYAMEDPVKLKEDTEFQLDIEKRIMQILFQCLDKVRPTNPARDSEKQANIIRTYLNLHLTEELTINQISHDLHMSARTIRHGFKTLFGMSPKKYLLNYRLGKVHNALFKSEIGEITVQEIANDHGFYHSGHFPRQYRDMFGESPLDTLKRSS